MVSCASCGEAFAADPPERLPKRLPCLDVYCAGCVSDLQHKSNTCPNPVCQLTFKDLDESLLPVDQMTMELIASASLENSTKLTTEAKIGTCNDCMEDEEKITEATHWCEDCEAYFCGHHLATHYTKKRLQNHVLVSAEHQAETMSLGGASIRSLFGGIRQMCLIHHDQPMAMYCTVCNVLACLKCALLHHKGDDHNLSECEAVASLHRTELEALMAAAVVRTTALHACQRQVLSTINEIKGTETSVILAIKEEFDQFRRAIVKQEKKLIDAVESEGLRKRNVANGHNEMLESVESKFKTATEYAVWALGNGESRSVELLGARAPLVNVLGQLLAAEIPTISIVSPKIAFGGTHNSEMIVAALNTFGGVSGADADATKCVVGMMGDDAGMAIKPVVGALTTFTVDLRDNSGAVVDVSQEEADDGILLVIITAEVASKTMPTPTLLPVAASRTGDAQVTFGYTPTNIIPITLDVKVLGLHVPGSPFTVEPIQGVEVMFKLWGAGGAGGQFTNGNHGGAGGFISGKYLWTPGEVLTVVVGSGGTAHTFGHDTSAVPKGGGLPNGGHARGEYDSGGGGGSTHIISSFKGGDVVVGAGGGGGAGAGQAAGAGGGGGGGTANGVVGKGGNGDFDGTAKYTAEMAAVHGGGDGGGGRSAGVPKHSTTANGAGGLCNGEFTANSGFGGAGGKCSHKHITAEPPTVHNAYSNVAPNARDEHYTQGVATGGSHGYGAGTAGKVVIIFLNSSMAPRTFDKPGNHKITIPADYYVRRNVSEVSTRI